MFLVKVRWVYSHFVPKFAKSCRVTVHYKVLKICLKTVHYMSTHYFNNYFWKTTRFEIFTVDKNISRVTKSANADRRKLNFFSK